MQQSFGFVYLWFDRVRYMFYLGSHHGSEHDGYLGSGVRFSRAIRKRPQDFRRRVIQRNFVNDPLITLQLEEAWLKLIKSEELGKRYYNLKLAARGGHTRVGRRNTPEHNARIGAAQRGIPHPWTIIYNKTRICSETTREKHRQNALKQDSSAWTNAGIAARRGRKHTPETLAKMRHPHKSYSPRRLGAMWITDGVSSRRVYSLDLMPDGWRRGRSSYASS